MSWKMAYFVNMDRYTKAFVVASLAYFAAGTFFGVWMGIDSAPGWAWFAHVHFNLLGFMAMMIYGVGYFILPRFNARPLVWPGGVAVHFYLANIGLVGMVATAPERPSTGFLLFSLISAASAAVFAANLGASILLPLRDRSGDGEEEEKAPEPAVQEITQETRIGEIITRWPATVEVFVNNGFAPLADPAHQEKVRQLPVTLAMGCANHGVDLERMLGLLNEAVSGTGREHSSRGQHELIGPDHVIGDILGTYPATKRVFRKYYGEACFSCPGQATETVRQSAMMHDASEEELLAELNAAAGTGA
jgi:hybrid cluster-associated redox disulfide protein